MTPNSVKIGDCLSVLRDVPAESVDLCYLDPPFFTQKIHALSPRDGSKAFEFSDIWQSGADYAKFLHERLTECFRILKETGSLYFHCDRNSTHIARWVLDSIFGEDAFRSEIIWYYRRWSNSQKGLLPSHQNIFFYSKTDDFVFNPTMVAYSPSTNADQILQRRVRDDRGKTVYERDANGDIVSSGAKKGVPLGDVWEIPYLNPKARERVGYPTQKPILLLERIISLSTNEGALVLDPFCGSGTTLVAAKLLNRRWFGIDISVDAVSLAEKRLTNPQRTSSMLMEKGRESYLNGDKSVDFVLQGIEYVRVHRNSGIDCILKEDVLGCPVFLRIQKDTETIYEAVDALRVASKNKGKAVLLVLATSEGANDLLYSDVDFGEIQVISTTAHAIRETLRKVRESIATPRLASAR